MSELTPCNHCTLQRIHRYAAEQGLAVTLREDSPLDPATPGSSRGITIYVHPLGIEPQDEHFKAWLMALTDTCCC